MFLTYEIIMFLVESDSEGKIKCLDII